jgi:hypothetical protein
LPKPAERLALRVSRVRWALAQASCFCVRRLVFFQLEDAYLENHRTKEVEGEGLDTHVFCLRNNGTESDPNSGSICSSGFFGLGVDAIDLLFRLLQRLAPETEDISE